MALSAITSRHKEDPFSLMKYQHPPSFRAFLIEMVKSFNINDRAAVSSWCRSLILDSKLDGKMATDAGMFTLITNLQYAEELSFINLSIMKYSLTSINHFELLQECLKLRITVAIIIEC